jgi:microsomal dipeptidase-like Zn-dependent dipeptidase
VKSGWKKALWALAAVILLLALLGALAVTALTPRIVSSMMNPLVGEARGAPSTEGARVHADLAVVDLHADALLWDVDLLARRDYGHVDLPRLVEGRVAVQAFAVVTKTPAGMNIESNTADSDLITWLALAQGWPPRTWRNLLGRALHQADKLHDAAENSEGRLVVIRDRAGLDELLRLRVRDPTVVGGVLGLEGAHALEGDLASVDRLFEAGFRSIGLTHFFDNEVGGSAHGVDKGGLTGFGRSVLARMEALGMAVDLAHASPRLVDDVLAVATRPVIVSHTGVHGTCDNQRNLDDARLAAIAATGGVVGIGLWETALCGESPSAWARAVRHAVTVAGVDHVALGSDWDGAVGAIVDAAGTVYLVDALLEEGFSQDEIHRIMGANALRVLRETLPVADATGGYPAAGPIAAPIAWAIRRFGGTGTIESPSRYMRQRGPSAASRGAHE